MRILARSVSTHADSCSCGGKPGVASKLAENLLRMFPGISIVGTFTPPFRSLDSADQAELDRVMGAAQPDIVWVGLSTPKQEKFMAAQIDRLPCKIMIGIGAAFDVHTGHVKDAPLWIKNAGLQWVHRLCQEPRRLWKRYLVNNSTFLAALGLQLTGLRRYTLPSDSPEIHS